MFRRYDTSVFFSCCNVSCCLICCQNRIFRIILMVSCIVRCTVKVRSCTPEDWKIWPDGIISGHSSVLCSHLFTKCLRNHCFITHCSEFVIQILVIRIDDIRICGICICICVLSQCIRIKSVRSVILYCLRRHDRYNWFCTGSTKSSTDHRFFQCDLINQICPFFICQVRLTFQACKCQPIVLAKCNFIRISLFLDLYQVIFHHFDHFICCCQIFICFWPGCFPVTSW